MEASEQPALQVIFLNILPVKIVLLSIDAQEKEREKPKHFFVGILWLGLTTLCTSGS